MSLNAQRQESGVTDDAMILYHYCSTTAFESIVRNKTFRASSLSLSNDTMEGGWLVKLFDEVAAEKSLWPQRREQLSTYIRFNIDVSDSLGFCLSEEGDLLSQWRGYADNGHGLSIGFSKKALEEISSGLDADKEGRFVLEKVLYDKGSQRKIVSELYHEILPIINDGALDTVLPTILTPEDDPQYQARKKGVAIAFKKFIVFNLTRIFPLMFTLKNPAFSEEKEWRAISPVMHKYDELLFRSARDRLIPYREFSFGHSQLPVIKEIIIGPKNITPTRLIEAFAKQQGLTEVTVRRSDATYR
jgi:hypothetical protein